MKIKEGFVLRKICGQSVISAEGSSNVNFSKLISLNESAAYLFTNLLGKEFDPQTMSQLLTREYDVDEETALSDSVKLARQWEEAGIVE